MTLNLASDFAHKPTAVSLFSGCGGFCEGIRAAGFDVKAAVEIDRFAAQTYRANFPETPLFEGDVTDFLRDESPAWKLDAGRFPDVTRGGIDLVFGGPPCQGFSQIGPRILDDPRNKLYMEFIRVLEELQPKVFLIENVPNMLLLAKGKFKREVLEALAAAGYSASTVRVVVASEYGVPQVRRRAIFFGVRDDLDLDEAVDQFFGDALEEQKLPAPSVWDAIRDLPETTAIHYEPVQYPRSTAASPLLDELRLDRSGNVYDRVRKVAQTGGKRALLHNHHTKEIQDRRKALIALLKPGAKGDSLPREVWNGLRPEKWRRLPFDRPAYTILAQMHRDLSEWVHPKYERWITVREAARLQSFHDGFVFHSSEWQMLKQIGNAVPPLMGRALGVVAAKAIASVQSRTVAPVAEIDSYRATSEVAALG
ncbi:DNA cytosine methyltransferase [Herbiconiux flava]|uniref:Cytosine-specific methyltransferase n=1 Tax=Herbiconiux flava TaxID=881268 RepID=A0A852SMW9_9MICO|nr:DNA cytosine methyltransferase [Herbiconiux flava]NYD70168.1 DNA (cytosine-5)-methyltransferase 1 [Herbiconiux flava]GLK16920.1 cytosine-specific methyltransferase [Herbiconiux flava]